MVSDAFEALARAEAEGLGVSGLPILVVPHPVGSRSADELVAEGNKLGSQAAAALMRANHDD